MGDEKQKSERQKKIEESFMKYRVRFDAKQDLHEQLVKKSRDITIESKRIIFLLHRNDDQQKILDDAKKRLKHVYNSIIFGIGPLLISEDINEYLQAFTAGMQEFVEAAAFYYYLETAQIISLEQINDGNFLFGKTYEKKGTVETLPMSSLLTPLDYILGLADLTGELMRKCISSGNLDEPFKLRTVLKDVYSAFLLIGNSGGRELFRKMHTLKCSLQKVENACYTIRVRGSEMEKLVGNQVLTLDDVFRADQPEVSCSTDDPYCD